MSVSSPIVPRVGLLPKVPVLKPGETPAPDIASSEKAGRHELILGLGDFLEWNSGYGFYVKDGHRVAFHIGTNGIISNKLKLEYLGTVWKQPSGRVSIALGAAVVTGISPLDPIIGNALGVSLARSTSNPQPQLSVQAPVDAVVGATFVLQFNFLLSKGSPTNPHLPPLKMFLKVEGGPGLGVTQKDLRLIGGLTLAGFAIPLGQPRPAQSR